MSFVDGVNLFPFYFDANIASTWMEIIAVNWQFDVRKLEWNGRSSGGHSFGFSTEGSKRCFRIEKYGERRDE